MNSISKYKVHLDPNSNTKGINLFGYITCYAASEAEAIKKATSGAFKGGIVTHVTKHDLTDADKINLRGSKS